MLSDVCSELIEAFVAVRDNPGVVIRYLRQLDPRERRLFYRVRENRSDGPFKRAAEFIFLNKACWNGLYRVNASGKFNVPYGRPRSGFTADFGNIVACAEALHSSGVSLQVADFEEALAKSQPGDLVYLDPPYVTGHTSNGFVDYNEVLFSWKDQVRLAKTAHRLAGRGVHVVVSSANHQEIVKLYSGFAVKSFTRPSTLAASASRRKPVSELLLYTSF